MSAVGERRQRGAFDPEPLTNTLIPVSCVEHGRWGYRSGRRFAPSPEFAHTRLRAEKTAAVAARRRTVGDAVANQGSVWAEVERRCSRNQPASG